MLTLLDQAHCIADAEHIAEECRYLQQVFLKNGYLMGEIRCTFALYDLRRRGRSIWEPEEESIRGVVLVPDCQTATSRLARLLSRHNIRMTPYPLSK